jgi:uncharacterized repeat protein (TIGR01451 family)
VKLEAINFRACLRPGLAWVGALALSTGFLFGSSAASAAPPPADTRIGNQASASYTDPSGTSQLATSNKVETLILQVGSFTLDGLNQVTTTVVNTKSGAAGTTLYAPHVITNTGNGADTFNITIVDDSNRFSRIQVFADPDDNGRPDLMPVLCTGTSTSCVVPAQSVAGNNGIFQFVVAYTIPASATSPTTSYDTSTITVTPGTPALYTAPNTSVADKDQINLTTSAAFSATKVIGAPTTVLAPGNNPWPASPSSGPRSSSASCSTSWSTALASATGCQYVVFTLDVTNTGGAAGKFVITDTLPSGFTYVTGSAVWSSFSGIALGDGNAGDPPGINYQVSGNSLTAVIDSISTSNTQSISFVALVNPTAGATNTTNVAQYSSIDAPTATVTAPGLTPTVTNPAKYTVKAAYAIVLGANPANAQNAADTTPGTVPNSFATDTTIKATAVPGSTIIYAQKAYNLGDATDTIDLSLGILTVEDPIEFVHESRKCLINQREVGPMTLSFANALRSALREDPDAILVGEMRDLETIRLAMTAAETGHLVFATLHTSSAAKTIDRIIDVFPGEEKDMIRAMLSESLQAVISQTLCKTKDGKGRVAAHEIMLGTSAIRNLIRESKVAQMYSSIQTGQAQGMQTLDQSLTDLVRRGLISVGEARSKAKIPENFAS